MSVNRSDKTYLPFLDGLRGLMAFWVLAGHTMYASGAMLPVIAAPRVAVDVFMFVSGFLMAYYFRVRESHNPWESPDTWGRFYIRRFFRIAPVYYLLLTATFILYPSVNHPPDWKPQASAEPAELNWVNVVLHYTFLFGFVPRYASSNALPDWSIGLEMQFYMVLPFIMLFYRRVGYFWGTAVLMAVWVVANKLFSYSVPPTGLLANFPQPTFLPLKINFFTVGILLAEAFHFKREDSHKSALLCFMAVAVAGFMTSHYFLILVCVSAFVLLYDTSLDKLGVRRLSAFLGYIFGSRVAKFMADTSYSVYLLHNLIILPLVAFMALQPWYAALHPLARYSILLSALSLLTYSTAFILFNVLEKPGIAFGKRILELKSAGEFKSYAMLAMRMRLKRDVGLK